MLLLAADGFALFDRGVVRGARSSYMLSAGSTKRIEQAVNVENGLAFFFWLCCLILLRPFIPPSTDVLITRNFTSHQ